VDQEPPSHRRERHALVGSFKENDSEMVFEFPQLEAESRLAHVACGRSTPKMLVLRDRNEILQLLKIQTALPKAIENLYRFPLNNRL
jgi:hypothetical protein